MGGEEANQLPLLAHGMMQGMALSPAVYLSMDVYLDELERATYNYYNGGGSSFRRVYDGEFYDIVHEGQTNITMGPSGGDGSSSYSTMAAKTDSYPN